MAERDTVVDISSVINDSRISGFQYWVVALCAFTVFLDGFDTQAIAFVVPPIIKEWHVSREAIGPLSVASLVGLLCGALTFGPIADKIGRRKVLIASTAIFAVLSIATGFAQNVTELMILRFLTGLGLGGAMPNAIALTAEYCPVRRRATLVMLMFTGFSLGGAMAGVLAAGIVDNFGWRGVFFVGGALPLALLPLQFAALPESIRFMVISKASQEKLRALVAKVVPDYSPAPGTVFGSVEKITKGVPVAYLFRDMRALGTALLWCMFFLNLLDLFFLQNWMPVLLVDDGIPQAKAAFIGSLFQFGGVAAALVTGFFIDKYSGYRVLPFFYGAGCLIVLALGQVSGTFNTMAIMVFAAGFGVVGAQNCANAHAANFYPTSIRATGVGWCLGIGRTGAIIGPILAGVLLSLKWPIATLFIVLAMPLALAFCAVIVMGMLYAGGKRTAVEERASHAAE